MKIKVQKKDLPSSPGIRQLIDSGEIPPYNPEFTEEDLRLMFQEILNEPRPVSKIVMWQGCLDQGAVERSDWNLNLCSNPDCVSCRMWDDAIKASAEEFLGKVSFEDRDENFLNQAFFGAAIKNSTSVSVTQSMTYEEAKELHDKYKESDETN